MMEAAENKRSKKAKTDIVCKFFLDAIKIKVYGLKWKCPNGDECHYKHCLPKDYVIRTLKGHNQEEMTFEEFHDLEEKIDAERERVSVNGTKVTQETLQFWLDKRRKDKEKTHDTKKKELLAKLKTGKELFLSDKGEFKDDDNADDDVYENQGNELEDETKNLQSQLWGIKEEKEEKEDNEENVKVDKDLFNADDVGDLDNVNLEDDDLNENEMDKEDENDGDNEKEDDN